MTSDFIFDAVGVIGVLIACVTFALDLYDRKKK